MCATILHVDINNFYAGVEIRDCPSLAGLPLVVGGDIEARHGIVLAKNNIAKSFGIQTAETIVSAVRKCPNLSIVPAHFEKYEQAMRQSREILMRFSDKIEPFGMDEASRLMPRPSKTAAKLRTGFANAIAANSALRLQSGSVSAKFLPN